MKITLFTLGTRGDVQPFAVLGQALASRGHQVTLSTGKNFKQFVLDYDIEFHPIDIDYEEILNSEDGKKILNLNPFAIQRNLNNLIFPLIKGSLNEFYRLAQTSDLIIYRTKTLADVFAAQLNTKTVRAAVIPAMAGTAAFFNPVFSGFRLPAALNKWSYKLNNLRYSIFKKPINQFLLQNGLEDNNLKNSGLPSIYGVSPHFLDRPDDWPENHFLTGFWFSEDRRELDADLLEFIEDGKPPVLITFGSMPTPGKVNSLILHAANHLNERFIIVNGWGDWDITGLKGNKKIKIVSTAPFKALLPKVKAVVHHGGIGTTSECLRAAKPMFACPVVYPFGDQYFWADLAYRKGVALKPIPLSKLTPEMFTQQISELLVNEQLYINIAAMAKKIRAENGVDTAVDIIEKSMNIYPAEILHKIAI